MISYKHWQLLTESMGLFPLGLSQRQSLGISGSLTGKEEGMFPKYMGDEPFGKKKPPFDMGDAGDGEEMPVDDEEDDEFGDEEEEFGDEEKEFGDEEEEFGDEEEELDDEEGVLDDEEETLDDEEEDLDDEEETLDDEEEDKENPFGARKKPFGGKALGKHPMAMPHDADAFMYRMSKEHCGCEDEDEEEPETKDGGPGDKLDKPKGDIAFLSKKSKKMKKKMKSGDKKDFFKKKKKCMNCKESSQYARPKSHDSSESAFVRSVINQFGKTDQRFWDGVHEDVLLPPEPQPGDVGFAPQGRLGDPADPSNLSESVARLLKRIEKLEKQLHKK